jgi:tetratricopeptide (TPR) repeat protein
MLEVVGQWVRLDADAPPDEQVAAALFEILDWLIEQRHWALLEPLETEYRDAFAKYRVLMYLAAEGYRQQGDDAEAGRRAELAYALQSPDDEQRVRIAEQLAVLGEVEWAIREYRYVIERFPVLHEQSLLARSELAVWLHDRGAYQEAAEAMGQFMDALERAQTPPNPADDPDRQAERQRLRADRERLLESLGGTGRSREQLQAFAARRQFYVACWRESEGRFDDQLKHLKLAIAANEQDADVLIALFRCPAADEQTQADTRERIARVSRFWLSLIEDYPDVAYLHNQWAWLIANTEGDFELAIKFSKRSLQLRPDEPSYLDTLGRCYYAAGQLEQAVETQRKAVELQPQMQVMRRQLQFFQEELAKRKS